VDTHMRYDFSLYFRPNTGRTKLGTSYRAPSKTKSFPGPTPKQRPAGLMYKSARAAIQKRTGLPPLVIDTGMKLAYEAGKAAMNSFRGVQLKRSSNAGRAINCTSVKETSSAYNLGISKKLPVPYAQSEVITVINKRYETSGVAATNGKWGSYQCKELLSATNLRTMSDTYFTGQVVSSTLPGYNEGSFFLKELIVDYTFKSTSTIEQELWIYDITPRYFMSPTTANNLDNPSVCFAEGIDYAVGTTTTGNYANAIDVPTAYTLFDSPAFLHWWTIAKITRVKMDPGAVHQHKKSLHFNSKVYRQCLTVDAYLPGVSHAILVLTKGGLAYNLGSSGSTGYEAIVGFDVAITEHYKMASLSNSLNKTFTNIAAGTVQVVPLDIQENDANASNAENLS